MWTRNYKNLITAVATLSNQGSSSASAYTFGDEAYPFNFKAANGNVYEICTYTSYSSYAGWIARAALVSCSTPGAYTSAVDLITSPTTAPTGYSNLYPAEGLKVALGSSQTEESELDYTLGSVISAVTKKSGTASCTRNSDGTLTINFDLIVAASADIVVAEVGLFRGIVRTVGSSGGSGYYALINRIVLDEPVSVASGDVAQIKFSVTTPKISFSE